MSIEPNRAEAQRLRAAVESAPSALILTDAAGVIVLVNHEVERLFGYGREELLGATVDILVPDAVRARHKHDRATFLEQPRARAMGAGRELFGRRKDGTEVPVEIGLTPVATDEGMFVVSAVVDITARRQHERERERLSEQLRQSQKMEAIGTLAGGIAHDFNNILAAIIGYAELLRLETEERPDLGPDIGALLEAGQRGKVLVERILAFSRQRAQEKRPMALAATVQETVKLLRASLPGTIEIRADIDPRAPRVLGDATSVQQVLMNLGTNAAHAITGEGRIDVMLAPFYARDSFVRAHPEMHEGPYVVLTARDDGSGMSPAVLARVFEPFFTTKAPGAGTGLGLSMVHRIMKDHGGAVYLESEIGKGTTVSCYFPAIEDLESPADKPEAAPKGLGERVLLVDDEPPLATVGMRRLTALGYKVITVNDGPEALAWIKAHPGEVDLLITDYWMPHMTGMDLAAAAHREAPRIPILMLTGFSDELDPVHLSEAGIVAVLCKPVTGAELGSAVARALAQASVASSFDAAADLPPAAAPGPSPERGS